MEMIASAGHYPDIIHPVFCEIFYFSMGLWEQNQESEVWSHISSPPFDQLKNDLQNEESIISESAKIKIVDEIKDQKAT
ncbi:hypothetical protein H5410_038981 [Solanum commersonii]|uniref:Uncharacterized protein n=1 Tax=Solanum commersonii TaxID=4109 RepID=A0A9J5YCA7_SOLCO|nr:hypothetical protein H5410_038981 [Solanum commersonii]